MWFRIFLLVPALVVLLLAGWFATHKSANPSVLGRYSVSYAVALAAMAAAGLALLGLQARPMYARLFPMRWKFALLVGTLALGICLLEVTVRLADPLGISYYFEVKKYVTLLVPDDDLIYHMRPNLRESFFGAPVQLNELGLRERPIGPKAAGEYRVLFLGDSITFGNGVKDDEPFARGVEPLLAAKLRRPVRTINAGVGSYNTSQEDAYLARGGLQLEPDLVVLMYVQNDFFQHARPFFPTAPSTAKSPLKKLVQFLEGSWLFKLPVHLIVGREGKYDAVPPLDDPGLVESMNALRSIAKRCRERGIPLVVFFWRWQIEKVNVLLVAQIEKVAAEEKFRFADILPWFAGLDFRKIVNSAVDSHPNARGHEITAEGIVKYLVESGAAPPPRSP